MRVVGTLAACTCHVLQLLGFTDGGFALRRGASLLLNILLLEDNYIVRWLIVLLKHYVLFDVAVVIIIFKGSLNYPILII